MMKKLSIVVLVAMLYSSCSYFIAPSYTSVEELAKVRKGMSITKVNEVLGIQAYDLYTVQDDGGTILVYNYRLRDRRAKVSGDMEEFTKSERGQKEGVTWFQEPSRAYILFKDDKMASMITDNGRQDAERLIIVNNNLQLISEEDLVNVTYNHAGQDVLMLNDNGGVNKVRVMDKNSDAAKNMQRSIRIPRPKENVKEQTEETKESPKVFKK